MASQLVELYEAAKKAADAAAKEDDSYFEEENRCLDALKELKDYPVNYDILVSTQVGKSLRSLTKHPRKKIQSFAADLIAIWKSIILEDVAQKKNVNSDGGGNSVKAEPVNSDSGKKAIPIKVEKNSRAENVKVESLSPRPQKLAKTERGPVDRKFENGNAVKVENVSSAENVKIERPVKQEKLGSGAKNPATNAPPKLTSIIKCGDPTRDRVRELLLEALSKVPGEADESFKEYVDASDPIRVAVSVESAMFDKWGRSNGAQKFKYRSIMFNIKDANNPDFRRKVLLGDIKPERLINLSVEEMASDQRQMENKQIKEKALFDCERGIPAKATTDQFKCGRCGQRKCTYYQLQTRSADEPMTTFVTCVNCNNHWKFC